MASSASAIECGVERNLPKDAAGMSVKRARKIAVKHGLAVASEGESEQLISAKFDGDPFQITNTIVYYDEENDAGSIINSVHPAWEDMKRFIDDRKGFYSTSSPDHIVRHEIGHRSIIGE